MLLKVSTSSLLLPDPFSASSISYQALCPNPSLRPWDSHRNSCCPPCAVPLSFRFDSAGTMEALKRPYFASHHRSLLSQPVSGDSTVEAAVHRKAAQVFPAEEVQQDEADRNGMAEKLQLDPVAPASMDWDSQAAADHP